MKVKLTKALPGNWDITVDGEPVGTCQPSYKYHGSYAAKLIDGVVINAFTLKSVEEKVKNYYTKN